MEHKEFISSFNYATTLDWKNQISKELKGTTFDDLSSIDRNGIALAPFYHFENDIESQFIPSKNDWFIMQEISELTDLKTQNQQLLQLLNDGVSGIQISVHSDVDYHQLLNGVDLKAIQCNIHFASLALLHPFQNFLLQQQYAIHSLNLFITVAEEPTVFSNALYIPATIFNNAGANAIFEVASILAIIKEQLDNLKDVNQIEKLAIQISVDTHYFEQISKQIALKNLVHFICSEYGINPTILMSVITSDIYRTINDEANNMLRDSVAAMAAILGGCSDLLIHNFSATNYSLAGRMAKNQQLILKEEAYLSQVDNMIEGAYFINYYADAIAQKAWAIFQTIESKGGWSKCLHSGYINAELQQQYADLVESYNNGTRTLLGVNKYKAATDLKKSQVVGFTQYGIQSRNIEQSLVGNF